MARYWSISKTPGGEPIAPRMVYENYDAAVRFGEHYAKIKQLPHVHIIRVQTFDEGHALAKGNKSG